MTTPAQPSFLYRSLRILFPAVMLLWCSTASAQVPDYIMKSSDDAFVVEVYHSGTRVKITLQFTDSSQYNYVTIERSIDPVVHFSQCKYLAPDKAKDSKRIYHLEDAYPLSTSQDLFYRIKTVSAEGVTRVYPPVRLPAGTPETKETVKKQ